MRRGLTLLLFLLMHGYAPSQEVSGGRSLQPPSDSINQGNSILWFFDKTINTHHWNGFVRYREVLSNLSVDLDARFLSTIIRTDHALVRDDRLMRLTARQRLSDRFSGVFTANSSGISDDQNIGIGSASSHTLHAGLSYTPAPEARIEPKAGMRFDSQSDQRDQGFSYALNGSLDNLLLGGYLTNIRAAHQVDYLDPRRLETHGDSVQIQKYFSGGTRNLLSGTYYASRREFYVPADSLILTMFGVTANIETRTDNTLAISDALDYRAGTHTTISLQGNILSRTVERSSRYRNDADARRTPLNSSIDEFRIDGGVQVRYDNKALGGTVRFFYQERDERHRIIDDAGVADSVLLPQQALQERKNNHSRRTALALDAHIRLSDSDSLIFSGSTGLLRYDTPARLNDDDRDELSHLVSVTSLNRIGSFLTLRTTAEALLSHLVYLNGTRSSDNTWNRVIRLSPEALVVPYGGLRSLNRFEVLANYTVYDFEYISSTLRSYVYRQFAFVDSTSFDLTSRVGFEWYSNLRFYDRGELRWSEFRERPLQYFEENTIIGSLRYSPGPHLLFSAGLRFFSLSRYVYAGSERSLESFLRSAGPITAIMWRPSGRYQFQFSGWYESQSLTGQPARNFANMLCSVLIHI